MALAPYQREPMEVMSDPRVSRVVLMWAAQLGKSLVLENAIGHLIHLRPRPVLMVQPKIDSAEGWSKERFTPMVRVTPVLKKLVRDLKSRTSENTLRMKVFPGGFLAIASSNSPAELAARAVARVFADEVDKYEESAGGEGDPVDLAERRMATVTDSLLVLTSTPGEKANSRIEPAFERGDQRRWFMPCPHCDFEQELRFGTPTEAFGLKWDKGKPETAAYLCENCHALIEETEKRGMLARGRWIAQAPEHPYPSFFANALISPFGGTTWPVIVSKFLEAKSQPARLQVFLNAFLAESWEDSGERVEAHTLLDRLEEYSAEVPDGVVVLTAAVDVQDSYLELWVWGWGAGMESWTIFAEQIPGDPGTPAPWAALDELRRRVWTNAEGKEFRIATGFVDSGGHHTGFVYGWCRPRQRERWYACKGVGGDGIAVVSKPTFQTSAKVMLYAIGVNTAKAAFLRSQIQVREPGPGYVHLASWLVVEHLEQLTSERRVARLAKGNRRVYEWVKVRDRNEALDCFDPKTQLLTRRGWVPVSDVAPKDLLATVNLETDTIEYQRPTALVARAHTGDMVHIKGRRINILVTPNHRMVTYKKVFDRQRRRWRFDVPPQITLAKDLTIHHQLKLTAEWRGVHEEFATIPASVSAQGREIEPERRVPAASWAAFLGWFVAEGHTVTSVSRTQGNRRWRVEITQNAGKKLEQITAVMRDLPWRFTTQVSRRGEASRRIVVTSKQLFEAVQSCGSGSVNKRVPAWILDRPPEIIRKFLDAAIDGDGWRQRNFRAYATVSLRLADGMQELFLKTGCASNIKVHAAKPYSIRGRSGANVRPQYHVSECRVHKASIDGGGNGRRVLLATPVHYDGMVYCATVPNGTLICRREGKSFIAGNCRNYAFAALNALPLTWLQRNGLVGKVAPRPVIRPAPVDPEADPTPFEQAVPVDDPAPQKKRRRGTGGYVNNW